MTSLFDELEADSQAATEGVFGEVVRIEPRRAGASQYREAPADPDRPVRDVTACVSVENGMDSIKGARVGTDLHGSTQFVRSLTQFWLSAEAYASLGYAVVKQDRVVRSEHAGKPRFVVTRAVPDAGGFTLHTVIEGDDE